MPPRLPNKLSLRQKRSFLVHFIFWSVIFLINLSTYLFIESSESDNDGYGAANKALVLLFHLSSAVVTCYFMVLKILPLIFERKKIVRGILELAVGLYIICVLSRISNVYGLEPILGGYFGDKESLVEIALDFNVLIQHYLMGIITGSIPFFIAYLLFDRYQMQEKQMQEENARKTAELAALKAQLNPHFLFNTLNNIYSLAIQQSPLASKSIEKFSYILDYTLYRCNDKYVLLENEFELLKNYIELEKIRYSDRLKIQTHFYSDDTYQIAPLFVLSIVENMFKHGVEKTTGLAKLQLEVNATNNTFLLVAKNTFDPSGNNEQGIGLKNVQTQLQLLYPGRHEMKIDKMNNEFTLQIRIQLS